MLFSNVHWGLQRSPEAIVFFFLVIVLFFLYSNEKLNLLIQNGGGGRNDFCEAFFLSDIDVIFVFPILN